MAALLAAQPAAAQVSVADGVHAGELDVPVNKSQVLRADRPYAKALIGNPDIADIVPITDTSLYVLGKKTGTTSLTLYDRSNRLIAVRRRGRRSGRHDPEAPAFRADSGRRDFGAHVERFGGPRRHGAERGRRRPRGADRRDLCAGQGRQPAVARLGPAGDARSPLRRGEALGAEADRAQLGRQRMARRRRSSARGESDAGKDVTTTVTDPNGSTTTSTGRSDQALGAIIDSFGIISRTFRAFGANFNVTLDALETKGAITTLAEPTLVALSGETASFLAGGEFPVRSSRAAAAAAAAAAARAITVEWKPFGVSLAFTPTVLADGVINMVVAPEVSSIDPTASIVINNLTIPGLQTRRAKTVVEMRDGESFAHGRPDPQGFPGHRSARSRCSARCRSSAPCSARPASSMRRPSW